LNANGNSPHRDDISAHIITIEENMSGKMEKACGADIPRNFLVATILSVDGSKLQCRFDTSAEGLLKFKHWLK